MPRGIKRPLSQCKACGKDFVTRIRYGSGALQMYCNRDCAGIGRRKRDERKCQQCGEVFEAHTCHAHIKHCSSKCANLSKKKPQHLRAKGLDPHGYMLVYMPEHPNAMATGYVREHRLIMAGILGRPMEKRETVHHINGIRNDNRPENLELWQKAQPAGIRKPDDAWLGWLANAA